jgi:hypothetical protein
VTIQHRSGPPTRFGVILQRIGVSGAIGAVLLTVGAILIVGDVFDRLEDSLEVSAETVVTVDDTLEVASDAMSALDGALATVKAATEQAATSSETIGDAVVQAVRIIGTDIPASVEAIRTAMPALIEASAVIDATLSGLAFFGVPYNPETPLDEAFIGLDRELEPLPASLRANALQLAELIPDVQGFRLQTDLLGLQVDEIRTAVDDANAILGRYRSQAERFDEVLQGTRDDLGRSALLVRLVVVFAGMLALVAMAGLVVAGRAISSLEARPW